MLSERTLNDPAVYMRLRGYPETVVIECAVCPKQFAANEGVAFPAKNKDGQPIIAAFCCFACYLAAMPVQILWRA
jgi:hypothetical protein